MNKQLDKLLDEWSNAVVSQLSRPKKRTPHLELAQRIHNHEEQAEINHNCRNGWDDEPTGLI